MNKRFSPGRQPKLLLAILLAGAAWRLLMPARPKARTGSASPMMPAGRDGAAGRAQEQANDAQIEATLDRQALAEVQAEAKAEPRG